MHIFRLVLAAGALLAAGAGAGALALRGEPETGLAVGSVRAADGGGTLPGARARFEDDAGVRRDVAVGPKGAFRARLPRGVYRASAAAPGHRPAAGAEPVAIGRGRQATQLVFSLARRTVPAAPGAVTALTPDGPDAPAGAPEFGLAWIDLAAPGAPGDLGSGRIWAFEGRGHAVPGARVRWRVIARQGRSAAVEIGGGEGLTGPDGTLAVRFRARSGGPAGSRRPGAPIEWRAAGRDDGGRPVEVRQAAGPGAARPRIWLSAPAYLRAGDRATIGARVEAGFPPQPDRRVALDVRGLDVTGALQRPVPPPGALAWDVAAPSPGTAYLGLAAEGADRAVPVGLTVPVLPVGRPVGQAWTGELAGPVALDFAIPPEAVAQTVRLSAHVSAGWIGAAYAAAGSLDQEDYAGTDIQAARLLAASFLLRAAPAGAAPRPLAARCRHAAGMLKSAQNPDGGWPWLPGGQSVPELSAFALRSLAEARSAGLAASPGSLDRGIAFLAARAAAAVDPAELADTVWALGAAGSASVAVRGRAWQVWKYLDEAHMGRLVEGLALSGDPGAAQVAERLYERKREEGGLAHWAGMAGDAAARAWDTGPVVATAQAILARLALPASGPRDDLGMAGRWLVRARRAEGWGGPAATAVAAAALARLGTGVRDGPPAVRALLDGQSIPLRGGPLGTAALATGSDRLGPGPHRLTLEPAGRSGGQDPLFAASLRFLEPEGLAQPRPGRGLTVRREYLLLPASRTARAGALPLAAWCRPERAARLARAGRRVPPGHLLIARLSLEVSRPLRQIRVIDPLPAGAVAAADIPSQGPHWRSSRPDQAELHVRELGPGTHDFYHAVRIRVPGTYHVPPPVAEVVHAPDTRARGVAEVLELAR